jgi:hypothetical protein
VQLGQDQYGNYVIQHVVEQGKPHERDAVYERLFPHIVVLSQNKFASNVVEKMLLHCTPVQRGAIVEEFLRQPSRRWVAWFVITCRLPAACLQLALPVKRFICSRCMSLATEVVVLLQSWPAHYYKLGARCADKAAAHVICTTCVGPPAVVVI